MDTSISNLTLCVVVFVTSNILDMDMNDSKIEEYLYNGGHLIILPGINSEHVDFYTIHNILPNIIDGNYKDLAYNELSGESFIIIAFNKPFPLTSFVIELFLIKFSTSSSICKLGIISPLS